jgi:hypothetical protein
MSSASSWARRSKYGTRVRSRRRGRRSVGDCDPRPAHQDPLAHKSGKAGEPSGQNLGASVRIPEMHYAQLVRDGEDVARAKLDAAAEAGRLNGRRVSGSETENRDLQVERTGIEPVTSGLQTHPIARPHLTPTDRIGMTEPNRSSRRTPPDTARQHSARTCSHRCRLTRQRSGVQHAPTLGMAVLVGEAGSISSLLIGTSSTRGPERRVGAGQLVIQPTRQTRHSADGSDSGSPWTRKKSAGPPSRIWPASGSSRISPAFHVTAARPSQG